MYPKRGIRAEALAAALFSLLVGGAVSVLVYIIVAHRSIVYDGFAAGSTVWGEYPKEADVAAYLSAFLAIPLAGLFFRACWKPVSSSGALSRLKKSGSLPGGLYSKTVMLTEALNNSLLMVVTALSLWGVLCRLIAVRMPAHLSALFPLPCVLFLILMSGVVFALVKDRKEKGERRSTYFYRGAEVLLSLQFLAYDRFFYIYEGETNPIRLFYSRKWTAACILFFLLFFVLSLLHLKKNRPGITGTLFIGLILSRMYELPDGILSVDFFHNGEVSLPMEQFLLFGKKPYIDFDPIHGFCDYYFSLLNQLFFDGSYMSQSAAKTVGMLIFGAVVGIALVFSVSRKKRGMAFLCAYFFLPYLLNTASFRYLVCFAAFFLLWSKRIKENGRLFVFVWVLSCIFAITWNVSIGAAFAVAFLPEAIYRFVKEVLPALLHPSSMQKKEARIFFVSYGFLVLLVLSYIPLFLQILRFLSENAATTALVNGEAIFTKDFRPLRSLALFLPYLFAWLPALLYRNQDKKERTERFFYPVSLLCFMTVLTNYVAVRYDEGLRLASVGVFFCILTLCFLPSNVGKMQEGGSEKGRTKPGETAKEDAEDNEAKNLCASVCILLTMVCAAALSFDKSFFLPDSEAVGSVPRERSVTVAEQKEIHPIVYVTGESVDMPALGNGFVDALCLQSLQNVRYVLQTEQAGDSYLDLGNKLSHYVILEKETPISVSSAYNLSNAALQKKAVEEIRAKKPNLILITPNIVFDEAPLSLRSFSLWQEILAMGYRAYSYEDVTYLLPGERASLLSESAKEDASEPQQTPGAENATVGNLMLGRYLHKEQLGRLPAHWGTAVDREEKYRMLCFLQTDGQTVVLPKEAKGKTAFLVIEGDAEKENAVVSFTSGVDHKEYHFCFDSSDAHCFVIPVASSPFWYNGDVTAFRLDGFSSARISFYEMTQ